MTLTHASSLHRQRHDFAAYSDEPLMQRPAGSQGKSGVCSLSFVTRDGATQLHRSFVTHPFHLTTPWHLDPALPGMAVAYLQAPAGGLIQGDRAHLEFLLAPSTQVHLTTQAAEKIHSMTANCAVQRISFTLGADAYAEYCPEPVLLFPGARFSQRLAVTLAPGAWFFSWEMFVSRRGADGAVFDALSTAFNACENNIPLAHERSLILPRRGDLSRPGMLGGHRVWGQIFLLGPAIPAHWSREVQQLIADEPHVICGVATLHRERGVCLKAVGTEVPAVRRVFQRTWHYLRSQRLGVPAPVFPK